MDRLIEQYKLDGPFLDVGCGRGDIALHLAQIGWSGMAIDISDQAVKQTNSLLTDYRGKVRVEKKEIRSVKGLFKTIILADVLEHVDRDEDLVRQIRLKLFHKGHLLLAVPINPAEWRRDDDFYGHRRRYRVGQIRQMLTRNGFQIKVIWDFTFPFFWLMRRLYTWIWPAKKADRSSLRATTSSPFQNAYEGSGRWANLDKLIWWPPVYWLQFKVRHLLWGHEALILAQINDKK